MALYRSKSIDFVRDPCVICMEVYFSVEKRVASSEWVHFNRTTVVRPCCGCQVHKECLFIWCRKQYQQRVHHQMWACPHCRQPLDPTHKINLR